MDMYWIVNSLGWFGLGVYAQWTWEYLKEEVHSARVAKPSKTVADQ